MGTDYKALVIELFGTDDETELRKIAAKLNKRNSQNAGRKRRFTDDEVTAMKRLRNGGMKINDIAKKYGTSRQIIEKYLNPKPQAGYTLRMIYMYKRQSCTVIDLDFLNQQVSIQNNTDDIVRRAFGVIENPSWEDFEQFLLDRCVPETRGNIKEILRDLQLDTYDPLRIVEKTHGRMADDDMWIKFIYYPKESVRR